MKSIIYVQHCLIPPVTLQTSPRGILEPWTYTEDTAQVRKQIRGRCIHPLEQQAAEACRNTQNRRPIRIEEFQT